MSPEINDPIMGTLVLRDNYYERDCESGENSYQFAIGILKVKNLQARLVQAQAVYVRIDALVLRAKEYAVGKLLERKNDSWTEEDERIVGPDEFKDRMQLTSVTLDHDNEVVLWFDDGDLFFGHDILVTERPDGSLHRGEIHG